MKHTFAGRIMAMLLALALLLSMGAMAEEVMLEGDGAQTEPDGVAVSDLETLDLPDVDLDIDLDDALVYAGGASNEG